VEAGEQSSKQRKEHFLGQETGQQEIQLERYGRTDGEDKALDFLAWEYMKVLQAAYVSSFKNSPLLPCRKRVEGVKVKQKDQCRGGFLGQRREATMEFERAQIPNMY
jgi:hypothetical protein